MTDQQARAVLGEWGIAADAPLTPVTIGNINATFFVDDRGGRWVLQRLNRIFSPEVHHDIAAVTTHLAGKGLPTPALRPTRNGALWTTDAEGGVWRLLTWMPGDNVSRADRPERCRAAGELLGRFHAAVADLDWTFKARRLGVHDTPRHMQALRRALDEHPAHPAHAAAAQLGEAILAARLPTDAGLPPRIVHGDPKINNIVFGADGRGVCFVDLDTLGVMTIPIELGDAFRSWCNPAGEDDPESALRLDYFTAGLEGYAASAAHLLTGAEKDAIVAHVERISVELAARFCADALNESYFGWDSRRFRSRSEHNLVRARSQWSVALSIAAQRADMQRLVRRLLG